MAGHCARLVDHNDARAKAGTGVLPAHSTIAVSTSPRSTDHRP
ncbi:hypothetical protein I551_4840 [Mycobacterium ulcerans str. Harvey]|uniref:Uncharacterized protein n=1 Tax=Mycobacterium ulcerans str. Harvey TaxID=1299332 RepID=A0ABN0QV55_MYCUL|nr:hypothetical protein I551_4840 [Mycobacterium ulcerans str. Harvey]